MRPQKETFYGLLPKNRRSNHNDCDQATVRVSEVKLALMGERPLSSLFYLLKTCQATVRIEKTCSFYEK